MKKSHTPIQSLSAKTITKSSDLGSFNAKKTKAIINKPALSLPEKMIKPFNLSHLLKHEISLRELPNFRKNSPSSIQNFIQVLKSNQPHRTSKDLKGFELVGRPISLKSEYYSTALNKDKKSEPKKKNYKKNLFKPEIVKKIWKRKSLTGKKMCRSPVIKISRIENVIEKDLCLQDSCSISINGWDQD